MLVKDLKDRLEDVPDDYCIMLTKGFVLREKELQLEEQSCEDGLDPDEGIYQLILDRPIVGVAINKQGNIGEVRFVLESKDEEMKRLEEYGIVIWK